MQEDMGSVPSLEDSMCHGATKPLCHNYWACALEPGSHNYWAHIPELLKPKCPRAHAPQQEKSLQWEAHTLQLEKACMQQWRPSTAKNKEKIERVHKLVNSWKTSFKFRTACNVQFSRSVLSNSLGSLGLQHPRLPCPSQPLWACSYSCPLSPWCHPPSDPLSSLLGIYQL